MCVRAVQDQKHPRTHAHTHAHPHWFCVHSDGAVSTALTRTPSPRIKTDDVEPARSDGAASVEAGGGEQEAGKGREGEVAGGQVGGGMAGDVGVAYVDARVISAQEALTKLNSLRSDEPPAVYEPLHARCPVYAAPVAMMQNNCFQ